MASAHRDAPQHRSSSTRASPAGPSFSRDNASMDPQPADPAVREDPEAHVSEGAARHELPGERMQLVRAELRPRQDLLPTRGIACKRREARLSRPAAFEGGALRVASLEMVRVDLDPVEDSGGAEPQDEPIMSRTAPPTRLPAVAHVRGAAGHDQVVLGAEVHVAGAEDEPAVPDRRQVEEPLRPGQSGYVHLHLT